MGPPGVKQSRGSADRPLERDIVKVGGALERLVRPQLSPPCG